MFNSLSPISIPMLFGSAMLDLDALNGESLNIYIPRGDLVNGDEVELLWWGCAADGGAVDINDKVRFDENDLVIPEPISPVDPPLPRALLMKASYPRLILLDQGQVFCSYRVQRQDGSPAVESARLFFQVGFHSLELPLAQLVESHAGWVPGTLDRYTLAVPPFNSMREGDVITMVVDGRDEFYDPPPWEQPKTLSDSDRGNVLTWDLPPSYVEVLLDGELQVSYIANYASIASGTSRSRVQTLELGIPSGLPLPLLEQPAIQGHDSEVVNPDAYPDGLEINVALYPGALIGDVVILHWRGASARTSTRKSLVLDVSNIDSQRVSFAIEHGWLADNIGQWVVVDYHYARSGRNQRSEPLRLAIRQPLMLPAVSVTGATLQSDGTYRVKASALGRNVMVVLPAEANYGPDDTVTVTWAAPGSGFYVTSTPTVAGGRTYEVPAQHVPAAMDQQFEVFYSVDQDGAAQDSSSYRLFVEKLAAIEVRPVKCVDVDSNNNLFLGSLPAHGTSFEQPAWLFKDSRQTLSMRLEGISQANTALTVDIAQDAAVQGGAEDGHFETVAKSVFERFKRDTPLDVHVAVRFEPSHAPISFRTLSITLRD